MAGNKRDKLLEENKNKNPIVQLVAGYPFKKNEEVIVKIDSSTFKFYSEDDTAWTNDDDKVIFAMKKGLELKITGQSSRGTITNDKYSLKGFTAAFNQLNTEGKIKWRKHDRSNQMGNTPSAIRK